MRMSVVRKTEFPLGLELGLLQPFLSVRMHW